MMFRCGKSFIAANTVSTDKCITLTLSRFFKDEDLIGKKLNKVTSQLYKKKKKKTKKLRITHVFIYQKLSNGTYEKR